MYSMRYKAYRYRLYPNKEQQELINKHIGCCRYIYNYGLEKKIKAYQECKKAISRFDIQRELPMLKKNEETSFLKEVNSLSLQAALASSKRRRVFLNSKQNETQGSHFKLYKTQKLILNVIESSYQSSKKV